MLQVLQRTSYIQTCLSCCDHYLHHLLSCIVIQGFAHQLPLSSFSLTTGHNRLRVHGRLKNWSRTDVERLLHQLVLENYLREDLFVTREDIAIAYVKPGEKIQSLLNGQAKVCSHQTFHPRHGCMEEIHLGFSPVTEPEPVWF